MRQHARFLLPLFFIGLIAKFVWAETTEIVTYYPAPAAGGGGGGEHVNDFTVGPGYLAENPADGFLLVEGRLGIGTNNPQQQLEITENFRLPSTTVTGGVPSGVIFSGVGTLIHTFGTSNFFAGVNAGNLTTAGNGNTGVGAAALGENGDGADNTAIGTGAMNENSSGSQNTAVGRGAMASNTTGWRNTAVGVTALATSTTGQLNTAVGVSALNAVTTQSENTAVGATALQNNTADSNTAVGSRALNANTIGVGNTALGSGVLQANTIGSSNVAVGWNSLFSATGSSNVAVGVESLFSITSGIQNTAVGYHALYSKTSGGGSDTAVGCWALEDSTTGVYNTALGYAALSANTTGSSNVAIGHQTGQVNTTGSNNTFIGYRAAPGAAALTNATAIGSNAAVSVSNALVLGGTGANSVSVGIGTASPNTRLHIVAADNATAQRIVINATSANVTAADTFISFDSSSAAAIGSVRGTAISGVIGYNTFTGSHYTKIDDRAGLEPNVLLEATGEKFKDEQNQLVKTRISTTRKSKKIYGVYGGTTETGEDLVLALGTGYIWVVNKGENLEVGDYLISSDVKGCAEKQDDDIDHNYTAAKAMEPVEWKEGEQKRLIACVYLGG
jgi:hypothetical protein